MSTLNVSNISDGTDTVGTSYVVNGSAKAWVIFTQVGTQTIKDSLYISSITDNNVGQTTVTHNMGSTNYSFSADVDFDTGFYDGNRTIMGVNGHSSTQLALNCFGIFDQTNTYDSQMVSAVFWGDLP